MKDKKFFIIGEKYLATTTSISFNLYDKSDWDKSVLLIKSINKFPDLEIEVVEGKMKGWDGEWTVSENWNFSRINNEWDT